MHPGGEKTTVRFLAAWRYRNCWGDAHAILGSDVCSLLQVAALCDKLQMLNLLLEAGAQTDLVDTSILGTPGAT